MDQNMDKVKKEYEKDVYNGHKCFVFKTPCGVDQSDRFQPFAYAAEHEKLGKCTSAAQKRNFDSELKKEMKVSVSLYCCLYVHVRVYIIMYIALMHLHKSICRIRTLM